MRTPSKSIHYLTDSPAKILFSICFPLILVNVVLAFTTTMTNQLYSIFVGQDAFSVTGYLSALTTAFANIVASVVTAAWIKTAHAFTSSNPDNASRQIGHGFAAIILTELGLAALLLLFSDPILSLLHIPGEIYHSAKIYYILYILFYLPVPIAALFLTIVNGTSSPAKLFWVNIAVVALNFIAAVLLLAVFQLGMVGLALAGAFGGLLQIIFDIYLFKKSGFHFSPSVLFSYINWKTVWEIVRYGLLIALQNLLCTFGYLLVTYQTNRYLTLEFISVLNVSLPLTGIMSAVSSACLAFCPQNYSAGKSERLRSFFRLAITCCFIYGIFCFLLYTTLGKWYYGRLFTDARIISHGIDFWFWYGLGHVFLAIVFSIRSFFDSVGLSKLSLLSGLGELSGNLLCAFWLIPSFGNIGRSLSYSLGWFFAAAFLSMAFLRYRKKIFQVPLKDR